MLTDELKRLLKVLAQVLFVAVGGRQPLVAEQAGVVVEERQVRGDIEHEADIGAPQHCQVPRVLLVAQVQQGQDGGELSVLDVRHGRQRPEGMAGQHCRRCRPGSTTAATVGPLVEPQRVVAEVLVALPERLEAPCGQSRIQKLDTHPLPVCSLPPYVSKDLLVHFYAFNHKNKVS